LVQLQRCELLRHAIERRLLPTVDMLSALAKKFGDKETAEDLYGVKCEDPVPRDLPRESVPMGDDSMGNVAYLETADLQERGIYPFICSDS